MIDLIDTAKCGLLDSMFLGTFRLPMMPTVVALTAFVVAQGTGRVLGHAVALRPLRLRPNWPIACAGLAAVAIFFAVTVALRGILYPLFLARMVKDAYYCSHFETARDLGASHWIVFGMMFVAQICCVMLFDDRRLRVLDSIWLRAILIAFYAALCIIGYVIAVSLDAVLVPLTILFILPFAYCGIGILARQR